MNEVQVNTKFIANPSFMIQSVGKQTITVNWRPLLDVTTPYDSSTDPPTPADGNYVGFCDWPLGPVGAMQSIGGGALAVSPLSVSLQPEITLKLTRSLSDNPTTKGYQGLEITGNYFFQQFLMFNPIHVTKLNVRSNDAAYLPATMEILTPNSFTGQFDRQIVNILADTNMYQNQSNIVTLDVDFVLTRYSIVRVDSSFEVGAKGTPPMLAMDFTFDKYLSLEKALVENYQLLQTNAGIEQAIAAEVANINAKTNDVVPQIGTVQAQMTQISSPWRHTLGGSAGIGSVQPATVKGNNY